MAIQKPTKLPVWDANETNIAEPPSTNQSDGWQVDANGIPQKPPFQYHNYMWNLQYKWLEYLDSEKAQLNGDNAQKFKVADAEEDDEALSKGQLLEAIKEVDENDSGINATTVNGTPKELLGIGGEGYQWVDETDNREFGTEYTNTTGVPIMLIVEGEEDDRIGLQLIIGGHTLANVVSEASNGNHDHRYVSGIIPVDATYKVKDIQSTILKIWAELKK